MVRNSKILPENAARRNGCSLAKKTPPTPL
jgi:hypothetical protein